MFRIFDVLKTEKWHHFVTYVSNDSGIYTLSGKSKLVFFTITLNAANKFSSYLAYSFSVECQQ